MGSKRTGGGFLGRNTCKLLETQSEPGGGTSFQDLRITADVRGNLAAGKNQVYQNHADKKPGKQRGICQKVAAWDTRGFSHPRHRNRAPNPFFRKHRGQKTGAVRTARISAGSGKAGTEKGRSATVEPRPARPKARSLSVANPASQGSCVSHAMLSPEPGSRRQLFENRGGRKRKSRRGEQATVPEASDLPFMARQRARRHWKTLLHYADTVQKGPGVSREGLLPSAVAASTVDDRGEEVGRAQSLESIGYAEGLKSKKRTWETSRDNCRTTEHSQR